MTAGPLCGPDQLNAYQTGQTFKRQKVEWWGSKFMLSFRHKSLADSWWNGIAKRQLCQVVNYFTKNQYLRLFVDDLGKLHEANLLKAVIHHDEKIAAGALVSYIRVAMVLQNSLPECDAEILFGDHLVRQEG